MAGFDYKDVLIAEVYREERMYEAEVDRLVRSGGSQNEKHIDLLNAIRNWLGDKLIHLGRRLRQKKISRYVS